MLSMRLAPRGDPGHGRGPAAHRLRRCSGQGARPGRWSRRGHGGCTGNTPGHFKQVDQVQDCFGVRVALESEILMHNFSELNSQHERVPIHFALHMKDIERLSYGILPNCPPRRQFWDGREVLASAW